MIQRINDPYVKVKDSNFIYDNNVREVTGIRLININDNRALHTHAHTYTQKDACHLKEVTMFLNRDDNDFWELRIADE